MHRGTIRQCTGPPPWTRCAPRPRVAVPSWRSPEPEGAGFSGGGSQTPEVGARHQSRLIGHESERARYAPDTFGFDTASCPKRDTRIAEAARPDTLRDEPLRT